MVRSLKTYKQQKDFLKGMSGDENRISVGGSQPSNPREGDEWYDTATEINYIAVENDTTGIVEWKELQTEEQRLAPDYVELTDLSIVTEPAEEASLTYNNVTGVFSYTPPVIPDVSNLALTSNLPSSLTDFNITDGTNGQILHTNGSGVFSFSNPGTNSNGVTVYANQLGMPLTGNNIGDLAFAEDTNRLFLWNNGWYMINTGMSSTTGGALYTTTGATTFTVPSGVTSICVLCVGGGGSGGWYSTPDDAPGGGGGALAYANNISVLPGQTFNIYVGAGGVASGGDGEDSWFDNNTVLIAGGGSGGAVDSSTNPTAGGAGGTSSGSARNGGGNGGPGGQGDTSNSPGGGGGAGGYSGNGGAGGTSPDTNPVAGGNAPSGGGGGGGSTENNDAGGGGGVGVYGQGLSGSGGTASADGSGGQGGSGGNNGSNGTASGANGNGGQFGGGGAGGEGAAYAPGNGANGCVRIIWGANRSFPSTNVSLSDSSGNEQTY